MISVLRRAESCFSCLRFGTILCAIRMQVTNRPSPDALSLTQAIIVQMVYLQMGPVRIRHRSHHFAIQSSHFVDRAGWQAKMASTEFWIPWRNAHGSHCPAMLLITERLSVTHLLKSKRLQYSRRKLKCRALDVSSKIRFAKKGESWSSKILECFCPKLPTSTFWCE